MAKYRRKPIVVEAVRWNKPGDHPLVIKDHGEFYIPTGAYPVGLVVNPGDYILTHSDGTVEVKTQAEMDREWEKVEDQLVCGTCLGFGKLDGSLDGYACGRCNGTGKVEE